MNVAGRKMRVVISTPGRLGRSASMAFSTSWVTSSVLAQGNFSTTTNRPGLVVDDAFADERRVAGRQRRPPGRSRIGAPLRWATTICAEILRAGRCVVEYCTARRWLGVSWKPALP